MNKSDQKFTTYKLSDESGWNSLIKLFEQYRGNYSGSRLVHALDHRKISSSFSQEELVRCLSQALLGSDIRDCFQLISRMCKDDVPFIIVSHEIAFLRDGLIKLAVDKSDVCAVAAVVQVFDVLEDGLARIYLENFLEVLTARNHVRMRHIASLTEKNLLVHFERHLDWMGRLVKAVAMRDSSAMPEVHHDQCEFGHWLHQEGSALIRDKSHYKHLVDTHTDMHAVVSEINEVLTKDSNALHLYALLKKAENYSLDLGNEIALLNSIVITSLCNKDPLTGTLTRRSLERVMLNQLEISALTESPFCIVMCDIDRFKQINDTHGHLVGDQFITYFSNFLTGFLRQSDMLFRIGGDEFLIVMPSTNYAQGKRVAVNLCEGLAKQSFDVEGMSGQMSASFGLMEVHGGNVSMIDKELVLEIIKSCDQKLLLAKQRGRNQVA